MTITGCDWPNFFSFCCSIYKFLWNSKIGSFYTYSCESPKLMYRFVHDMTVIPPQNLTDQTDRSSTTKPSTSDWWQYHSKPDTSDWQQYCYKAWYVRLTAVLPQSLARQTDSAWYCHKAWHIRLTAVLPQSLARQTDSNTATKPGMSDWQYCHKARHVRLTAVLPQSLACQTDTATKPGTSDWQQYCHKARHVRLISVPPQSPTHQTKSNTNTKTQFTSV